MKDSDDASQTLQQLWTFTYNAYSAIDGLNDYVPQDTGPREDGPDHIVPREYLTDNTFERIHLIHDIPYYPYYCPKIRYEDSSVFDSHHSKAHCVSADFHMGMGIAKQFRIRYKNVQLLLRQQCKPGRVAILTPFETKTANEYVFYLVTKTRYFEKPNFKILEATLIDMCDIAITCNINVISIPMIGTGLDRLKWTDVYYILAKTLMTITKDYDLTVIVHRHDETKDKQVITFKLPRRQVSMVTTTNLHSAAYLDLANDNETWPCFDSHFLATYDDGNDVINSDLDDNENVRQ